MQNTQLRRIIIIGCIVVGAILFGIFMLIQNNGQQSSGQPNQEEYTDPISGDVVQNTDNKTPEKYGVDPNQPVFLGFAELLDRGMTLADTDTIKTFLTDYNNKLISEKKTKIARISIEAGSVKHTINRDLNQDSVTMNIATDAEQWFVFEVTTNDDTDTRTLTLTQNNTVVFSTKQTL
jgi:hypothetical protein